MVSRVLTYNAVLFLAAFTIYLLGLDLDDVIIIYVALALSNLVEEYKFRHLRRLIETQHKIIKNAREKS